MRVVSKQQPIVDIDQMSYKELLKALDGRQFDQQYLVDFYTFFISGLYGLAWNEHCIQHNETIPHQCTCGVFYVDLNSHRRGRWFTEGFRDPHQY